MNRASKKEALQRLREQIAPVSLANTKVFAVPPAFESLFPSRGLQHGWCVGVSGTGSRSIGFSLAAAAAASTGWVAVVGVGDAGFAAAEELGVDLGRVLVVESVPQKRWAEVVVSLLEVIEVVLVCPQRNLRVQDVRRLRSSLQTQRSVVISLDGGSFWPEKLDVLVNVRSRSWSGIEQGWGHIQSRCLDVEVTGRRSLSGHARQLTVKQDASSFSVIPPAPTHGNKSSKRVRVPLPARPLGRTFDASAGG